MVLNLDSEFGYLHVNNHPDASINNLVAAAVLSQIIHFLWFSLLFLLPEKGFELELILS